jgi:hypothetical protein
MSYTDVVITGATVLASDVGVVLPSINTIAFNSYSSWPAGWANLGLVSGPVRIRRNKDVFQFDAQQYADPVVARIVGKQTSVRFELGELTLINLAHALDPGANATISPGAGVKGSFSLDFGSDLTTTERQYAVEGFRVDTANTQQPVRAFFYRCITLLENEISFNKRDAARLAINLLCLVDTTKTQGQDVGKIQVVTAPASS